MSPVNTRRLMGVSLCIVLAVGASGCTRLRAHQGYIADPVLTESVQAGVDNRDSVAGTLGRPTFTGQFDDKDWYYVSRETRQLAFAEPKATQQTIIHVRFDDAGNVASVERTGLEKVVSINPEGAKTPVLGRDRSFFQDIFGNIGSVGAPGSGSGQSNDPTRPN